MTSPRQRTPAPSDGPATQLVQTGRNSLDELVYVNPPLVRGTTVLAPTLGTWRERARLDTRAGLPGITPYDRQDSALLSVLAQADALLIRPMGDGPRQAGDRVDYLPL